MTLSGALEAALDDDARPATEGERQLVYSAEAGAVPAPRALVLPAGQAVDREPGERQQRRELGRGVVDDELAVGASGGAGEMREGVERDDVSSESGRVTTVAPRESAGVAVRGAVGQSLGEALFAGGCGMVAALIEPSRRRSALARSRARAPRVL
jgi:hypothetical protein